MIENAVEIFFLFLMLYITIIVVQSKITEDSKKLLNNFEFFHSIVEINLFCNNSTGSWERVYIQDVNGKFVLKFIKNSEIYYYCNGTLTKNSSFCFGNNKLWLGLPVIAINKSNMERYHALLYRCLE